MNAPQFLKQKNMLRVLYALAPLLAAAVFLFGWRSAAVCAVTGLACLGTEWVMTSRRGGKVSYACFVTAMLLGLSMPPTVPLWICVVAGVVAILFGKEAFGGFGKNVFNPAVVGRAFVYVSFPRQMTASFVPAFRTFPGGLTRWSFAWAAPAPQWLTDAGLQVSDAVSAATPLWARRDLGHTGSLWDLCSGSIGEAFSFRDMPMALAAGSMGEVSAILILLSAAYLLFSRTANWRLMLSCVCGALAASLFLRYALAIDAVAPPLFTLCSGGLLFAAVFMVTDPVSAPKRSLSQWIYGAFIGFMIVFFRYKAIFAGGVGFAILLGNMLAPSFDLWLGRLARVRGPEPAS